MAEHIGEAFHERWYEPAAVAERAAHRAEIHRFFDEIRDRARAVAEAEELTPSPNAHFEVRNR